MIHFFVDGREVGEYYSESLSIPVGSMELICAEGLKGKDWIAKDGSFVITAEIEIKGNNDLNPANNRCESILAIPGGKAIPIEIAEILK